MRVDLNDGWTLRAVTSGGVPKAIVGSEIPATVPGCVHTDLLDAGLIPDPYADTNETVLGWIGRTDWSYRTSFDADALIGAERVDLVCDGLDTVAEIRLNGHVLGETRNMHRGYRFDLRPALRDTGNELEAVFTSPYRYAEELRDELGDRPNAYPEPFQFIRKMACNFGWDWGPTLVTSGIWRPIRLEAWSTARLAAVRPEVRLDGVGGDGARGVVRLHVEVERFDPDGELVVTAETAGVRGRAVLPPGTRSAALELHVSDPEVWWPRGYGDQPLYDLDVALFAAGAVLDSQRRRIGFRTVELDTRPDPDGIPFHLRVNGRPVLVKGANWIPDDCFPARVGPERYRERIGQAADAHMNLLRVWGGGRYESEEFYRICDEQGMLVWQDFLFACAAYPEEPPIAAEVEAEAREAVVRLAAHPSLVLWCGNNENIEGHADWGWQDELGERTWGAHYYFELLPAIVAELDPTRPYWPGSPYSGSPELPPNDPAHGTMHVWDVWNRRDYTAYRDHRPRLAAEFGFQGPPAYATLRAAVGEASLHPDSPGMLHRQKAEDGQGKLARGLAPHFGAPEDFTDWHYLTQVNQARALTLGVEHFRAQWPLCSGTVVWQLNDCWPVISWSAVDGGGRRKPLWYALRRAYRARLLTLQPDGDGLALVVGNDTDEAWAGSATLARRDLWGTVLAQAGVAFHAAPRGAQRVPVPTAVAAAGDPARELLTAGAGQERAWWFFAEDREIDYPVPDFDATAVECGEDLRVTIAARTLLRDIAIFADRLDPRAEADDLLVTLLPGESHTFTVAGGGGLDPDAVVRPPVLRCVNDALTGRRSGG